MNHDTEKTPLTVAQLIEKLENVDPELIVTYSTWEDGLYGTGTATYGITDVCSDGETVSLHQTYIDWVDDSDLDDDDEE